MAINTPSRKIVAAAVSVALAAVHPIGIAGDLNSEVNSMFNNLGAIGNYTSPGAFKGQTYNTYTGGNLYIRSPNKTYQLASFAWPSAKAGCGGIDLFAGSFSHISAAEFKNMLKNITAALPGVAFSLAMKAVSPLLGGVMDQFKSWEQWLTSKQIGSCEAATSLVSSAAEAAGFDANRACRKLAVETGLDPDDAAAALRCKSNSASVLASARGDADPNIQSLAPFVGNLTWKALQAVDTLDDQSRELVMSIIGTYIFYPETDNKEPVYVGPSITEVAHLLYGQSDGAGGNINVQLLSCNNYTDCDVVTRNNSYSHEPLTKKVEALMQTISTNIRNRTAIPNDTNAVGFVNSTSLPVWRMLSVGNSIPGSGLADTLIANYKEVIAADYASSFLRQFATVGMAALGKSFKLTKDQQRNAETLRSDAQQFLGRLQAEQTTMYAKVQSVSGVANDLERLERNLRTNMTAHVLDMLGHSTWALR